MILTIIVIGDEILLGQVTDTNSGEIARTLGPRGWNVLQTVVVGDDATAIRRAVSNAMEQSDLVITTGGLGPTKDDITKKVLADYFGGGMHMDVAVLDNVARIFEKRGLVLNDLTRAQANVPDACRVIQNQLGTAPIMWFEQSRSGAKPRVLVSMPGVPFEMAGMLHQDVADEISRHFNPELIAGHHTVIVHGIAESALAIELEAWETSLPTGVHLAYLPAPGYIRLRLDVHSDDRSTVDALLAQYSEQLLARVRPYLLYDGDASLAQILLDKLSSHGYTVSTAESCTGGNIAHQITMVPGSSASFYGGVVSYDNSVKTGVLGVDAEDLSREGAVSETVVRQMAEGASRVLNTDCAIATSGIAGPGGAVPGKPVGTVWISVHLPGQTAAMVRRFPGDRARVIDRATSEALMMLIERL